MNAKVLIVEDEDIARENMVHILNKSGFEITAVETGNKALKALDAAEFDLVITDLRLPDIEGVDILLYTKENYPDTEVLMVTGYATVASAVEAMQKGAYHYLSKPFNINELRILVQRAIEQRSLRRELGQLRLRINKDGLHQIIGQSPQMQDLKKMLSQVASIDSNVLILGETGTGKELAARSIHLLSPRKQKRFVAINCASFNEDLLANELFGHEPGAFTGAGSLKKGLLEVAAGGTFFLDEISDMPLPVQAKLLRVLEDRIVTRLGGTEEIPVDVRILGATNKDLKAEVERSAFRNDLFYRLNVITIRIPPLSDRKEDIQQLVLYFLDKYTRAMNKQVTGVDEEVIARLRGYEFPGNVRELENILERAVALCEEDRIRLRHLPPDLRSKNLKVMRPEQMEMVTLEEQEKRYIECVLQATRGNKSKAAEILGIDRVSLWRKLKRYGLGPEGSGA